MTRSPFRKPVRITITVSCRTYSYLIERSNREGRSMSNLASYLLESSLEELAQVTDYNKSDVV